MQTLLRRATRLVAFLWLSLTGLAYAQNYSDIWWNPAESGWGVTIADHETDLFAVWYTYDVDGSPLWFSVSGGVFGPGRSTFTGDLYRSTGPAYIGTFDPAAVTRTKVGTASFQFTSSSTATVTWTVNGVMIIKQIQRYPFGNAAANWGIDRTDMWWNPAESGWGLTIAQHGNNYFGAWFTYASTGRPMFIVMPGVQQQAADSFTGALYTTTGPPYTAAPFDPSKVQTTPVGTATVKFNGDTGTFTATVNGITQVKTISRLAFGGPAAPAAPPVAIANRVEQDNSAVAFSGAWTQSPALYGWSGGSAMQSTTAGARATFTFNGSSVRWIGARGRTHGIAQVSVDGGPPRDVSLFARPSDEIHTPVLTITGLSPGQHTLTITVAGKPDPQGEGNLVVVDAFDLQVETTVSHWQDSNPGYAWSGTWTKSSTVLPWSGAGVQNLPELAVTAQESQAAGSSVTVPFRGTGISWIGFRGPDAGIAQVRIDGGAASEVDLYAPVATYQPIVFVTDGLADANHTLTITVTGRKNPAASAARVVVDAFDVVTPGRRYQEDDPSITYAGKSWTFHNDARVWSEGAVNTANMPGDSATFTFTGTSVSWIGCRKGSAGGTANVYVDGVFQQQVMLSENYPTEGYQMTVFRKDGLPFGQHTLKIEVVSNNGSYVVVDAFDVR